MDNLPIAGIEPSGLNERVFGFWDSTAFWALANANVAQAFAGGFMGPQIGLMAGVVVLMIISFIGYVPHQGVAVKSVRYGIPQQVALRDTYGIRGSYLGTIVTISTMLAWLAIIADMGGMAMNVIGIHSGLPSMLPVWAVGVGIGLPLVIILLGPVGMKLMERIIVVPVLVIMVWLLVVMLKDFGWSKLGLMKPTFEYSWWYAVDLGVAMSFSWFLMVGDIARFGKEPKKIGFSVMFGLGLMSFFVMVICAISRTAVASEDPTAWILGAGLGMAGLVVYIGWTISTNVAMLLASAMALLNVSEGLFDRLTFRLACVVSAVIGGAIYQWHLYDYYMFFLNFIAAVCAALFGPVLWDYFVSRKGYTNVDELYKREDSAYWYHGGVNWAAISAFFLGLGFYALLILTGLIEITSAAIPTLIFSGAIYGLFVKIYLRPKQLGGYELRPQSPETDPYGKVPFKWEGYEKLKGERKSWRRWWCGILIMLASFIYGWQLIRQYYELMSSWTTIPVWFNVSMIICGAVMLFGCWVTAKGWQ